VSGDWSPLTDRGNLTVDASGEPQTVSLTPDAGTIDAGIAMTLSATFRHTAAWQSLKRNDLIVATSPGSAMDGCWLTYRADLNKLYLLSGFSWLEAGAPGSGTTVQNGQCILDAAASSVAANGTDVVVDFRVTFKAGFAGSYDVYMQNQDRFTGTWSPLTDRGDLTVQ
jgi:hypothetical protein